MSLIRRLFNLFRSNRHARDLDRELEFHLAERIDALAAGGMSRADATFEARRMFGNRGVQKERTRDIDVVPWLDSLAGDVRYAVRALRNSPVFSLVAILSLGLGIGANTAIFTLIDAVMLRSLPVEHPEQLMKLTMGKDEDDFTNPIWEQLRDHQNAFSGVFAFSGGRFNLTSGGEARYALGSLVSGDFFRTLGVRPEEGRLLATADDVRGCPAIAVLSDAFWRTEYGGSPDAVGKTITLNTHPFRIVGVSAPGFVGLEVGYAIQVFAPLCGDAILRGSQTGLDQRSNWWLRVMGRPAPGMSAVQIRNRLRSIAPGVFAATVPDGFSTKDQAEYQRRGFDIEAAAKGRSDLRNQYSLALETIMAIVALVLLIACANVANLLLARAAVREQETAVRVALGAGRGRLVRQFLTESLLLSLTGAAVGIVFARWGTGFLVRLLSSGSRGVPIVLDLGLNYRVFGFSAAIAIITGVAFGLAPAWRSSRVAPNAALKANARGVVEGYRRWSASQILVIAQIAISLTLVVGAGLLLGTFRRLSSLDPGFKPDDVLLVSITQPSLGSTGAERLAIDQCALERLRGLPGVTSASISQLTPMGPSQWNDLLAVEGFIPQSKRDAVAWRNEIGAGYFQTLGTKIVAGRDFNAEDRVGSRAVAIVDEMMASHFFHGVSPVGRVFRTKRGASFGDPVEIVGVVKDAKYRSLREKPQATFYVPMSQDSTVEAGSTIELRVAGGARGVIPTVKAALSEVNPTLTITFTTLKAQVDGTLTRERVLATLSAFFGGLALLLSTLGLYGVMSYNVARRRNEIGIRMALGAGQRRVTVMVLGNIGVMVAAGLALGLALSFATTRFLSTFLFGVAPTDAATLGGSIATLAAVALLAAYLPARRAARVDPMEALREQ